jgi:DNA invertase Pin-like site-specific DNA recombinase
MKDRIEHGTSNRGEKHGIAKLTEEKVMQIFTRAAAGEPQHKIAKDFCVTQTSVSRIKNGECWGWLTGARP